MGYFSIIYNKLSLESNVKVNFWHRSAICPFSCSGHDYRFFLFTWMFLVWHYSKFFILKMSNEFKKGFTLVELLVTVSIATILMSLVLFNYGTFNDNIALSSAGQEMAIAVRQAQAYGVNVKEVKAGSGKFNSGYGIYFNPADSPSDYYIFVDTNGDKKYDAQMVVALQIPNVLRKLP